MDPDVPSSSSLSPTVGHCARSHCSSARARVCTRFATSTCGSTLRRPWLRDHERTACRTRVPNDPYKIRSRGKVVFHPVGAHKTNDWRWVEGHWHHPRASGGRGTPGRKWVEDHWERRVMHIEKIVLPRHCELALSQPRLSLPCDQQLLWQSWAELRPAPAL